MYAGPQQGKGLSSQENIFPSPNEALSEGGGVLAYPEFTSSYLSLGRAIGDSSMTLR